MRRQIQILSFNDIRGGASANRRPEYMNTFFLRRNMAQYNIMKKIIDKADNNLYNC